MKLSGKIALTTLLIALVLGMLIGGISIFYMKNYLLSISQIHAKAIAQTAAASTDSELLASLQPGDEDTDAYQKIRSHLQDYLLDEEIGYIYTMRQENGSVTFIVDGDAEDPAAIGEAYESYDKIDEAFAGNVTLDDEVTKDEWGSFYSAFAPITDDSGAVTAIVGVDCTVDSINEKVHRMVMTLISAEVFCVIGAFIVSLISGQLMARNVQKINRKMAELAGSDGDLTHEIEIHSGDELENVADNFNAFMVKLRGMMLSVKDSGDRLEVATTQTNEELSQATDTINQIVNTLHDITGAMQETNNSVADIQKTALSTKDMSASLYEKTRSGADYAEEVSQTADQAKEACEESKTKMTKVVTQISETLGEQITASKKVEKIMELTNDIISISEQTRLLALNASIEAARAGEQGRGFAVVADEISNLADSTTTTAREIEQINQFTVDTLSELSGAAEQLIQFIHEVVGPDYDRMVGTGQSYYHDCVEFKEQFQQFCQLSEELSENMSVIEGHISQITTVLEKETSDVTNAASTTQQIYGTMQTATDNGQVNKDIAAQLGDLLGKFTL
jgi:methyl-accepting chemotaxis protein